MTERTLDADASGPDTISRRAYLQATGAAALGATGLAGCVGRATGTLATQVTDQPADIADFESLVVTVEGIWLGPEGAESGAEMNGTDGGNATDEGKATDGDDGGETDEGGEEDEPAGREHHEFDEPQAADLVRLQNGETQLIDERELAVGTYRFLQLDVSNVDGTLEGGDEAEVDLPGNAPLTFNEAFEVRESTRTSFTADFAPVRRGTGAYLLRPVPQGIEVSYEGSDGSEGGEGEGSDGAGDDGDA
ncbi:DUF4382 domain-containing protein [Halorubrum sp. Boch-26]|uniref:DUF4382 domain-containing protein n=1 Tax=Halorubrum sp. Boch-26 TaxID=2994426 RepID=UPI002468BCA9|nr:DUF4382 domain-containing protein [Halorubrum sp. Boch-26]